MLVGFPLGGCENQIAYSVFSRKNMKLAAGFIADSEFRFAKGFPFRGLLETRRSSYFVLKNNCMLSDYWQVLSGKLEELRLEHEIFIGN